MVSKADIQRLDREIDSLRDGMRWLTERVYALEHPAAGVPERKPVQPAVKPAVDAPVQPAVPPPVPLVEQQPLSAEEPAPVQPQWEAALGGSWLNKVGVLVLVIGLALFLWYSFGRMGPGGRVAVSLAVSVAMIAV